VSASVLAMAIWFTVGAAGVRSPEVLVVYQKAAAVNIQAGFVMRPFPQLGVGMQFSYGGRRGTAVLTETMETTDLETRLHMGNVGIRFEGRLEMVQHQPLVPYIVGGPMVTWYREQVETDVINGMKPGAMVGMGAALLLTPETSYSIHTGPGLEGVYLVVEGGHRWARWASGRGMDLGGWQLHGGVEVMVR